MATDGFALMPDYVEELMPAAIAMRRLSDGPPPLLLTIAYPAAGRLADAVADRCDC